MSMEKREKTHRKPFPGLCRKALRRRMILVGTIEVGEHRKAKIGKGSGTNSSYACVLALRVLDALQT
jgi:hypothetical protein